MRNLKNTAFTLVELLVVITILAIISVVAYQNFGWAVDKAVSGRKINDISTIETALQQYKVDNNYYPATEAYDASANMWGYNSWTTAKPSNTIDVTYDKAEITILDNADGGWKVYWLNDWSTDWTAKQIWAKWTISRDILGKKYLSKDLYDPENWDLKIWSKLLIDSWVWRYVYATYKKAKSSWDWTQNYNGTNYNLAFTIKENWTDKYVTRIVGDYDEESCYDDKLLCPSTLIWSSNTILIDKQEEWKTSSWTALANYDSKQADQWIPYAVTDFAE